MLKISSYEIVACNASIELPARFRVMVTQAADGDCAVIDAQNENIYMTQAATPLDAVKSYVNQTMGMINKWEYSNEEGGYIQTNKRVWAAEMCDFHRVPTGYNWMMES